MNNKMAIFIFSVNVINRLLLSFLVLTKVITLSGVHCTLLKTQISEKGKFISKLLIIKVMPTIYRSKTKECSKRFVKPLPLLHRASFKIKGLCSRFMQRGSFKTYATFHPTSYSFL